MVWSLFKLDKNRNKQKEHTNTKGNIGLTMENINRDSEPDER